LIVDDEFSDLNTMKTLTEKAGHTVATATNGAQALDLLEGDGFSLILVDIRMPTLSGYDLLRLLRSRLNGKSKIFFVSIIPKGEVDLSNADGFIQKPFSNETFLASIKKVLGK
jgi:CheY-like chemotaxis protein